MNNNQPITKCESCKKICKAASQKRRSPIGSASKLPFYPSKDSVSKPTSLYQEFTTNGSLNQCKKANLESDSTPKVSLPGEDCPSNARKQQTISSTDVGLPYSHAQPLAKKTTRGPDIESLDRREKVNLKSDSTPKISSLGEDCLGNIGKQSISSNDVGFHTFPYGQPWEKKTTHIGPLDRCGIVNLESYSTPKARSLDEDYPRTIKKEQPVSLDYMRFRTCSRTQAWEKPKETTKSLYGYEKVNLVSDLAPKVRSLGKECSSDIIKLQDILPTDMGLDTFPHAQPWAKRTMRGTYIEPLEKCETIDLASDSTAKASSLHSQHWANNNNENYSNSNEMISRVEMDPETNSTSRGWHYTGYTRRGFRIPSTGVGLDKQNYPSRDIPQNVENKIETREICTIRHCRPLIL